MKKLLANTSDQISAEAEALNAELCGKLDQLRKDLAALDEAKNVPQELMDLTFSF